MRRHATRFVVRPDHVRDEAERTVSRGRAHAVIQKVDRVVARIAERLNPRPETS